MVKSDEQHKAISIHAPREGGDDDGSPAWQAFFQFQSTPPARGATSALISLRPLTEISIHAPREGGDVTAGDVLPELTAISIHAPREGGDNQLMDQVVGVSKNFNPRPPRGGRQKYMDL